MKILSLLLTPKDTDNWQKWYLQLCRKKHETKAQNEKKYEPLIALDHVISTALTLVVPWTRLQIRFFAKIS